jgi:hemoglobin-like flavoprotein
MSPNQIGTVKRTFARVAPDADAFAAAFYARLFELDPGVRELFHGDVDEQGRKLMSMLAMAVNGLDRFDQVAPTLTELGERHATYGVHTEHYATMERALMDTLLRHLGDEFDDAARHAWTQAYRLFAETMTGGHRPVVAA